LYYIEYVSAALSGLVMFWLGLAVGVLLAILALTNDK
jgi:hypothetical protein